MVQLCNAVLAPKICPIQPPIAAVPKLTTSKESIPLHSYTHTSLGKAGCRRAHTSIWCHPQGQTWQRERSSIFTCCTLRNRHSTDRVPPSQGYSLFRDTTGARGAARGTARLPNALWAGTKAFSQHFLQPRAVTAPGSSTEQQGAGKGKRQHHDERRRRRRKAGSPWPQSRAVLCLQTPWQKLTRLPIHSCNA